MITSYFTNGLGNRLFTLSKLLTMAQEKNLEPVFVQEICAPNKHCPVNNLFSLFPDIRVVHNDLNIKKVKPPMLTILNDAFLNKKHLVNERIKMPFVKTINDTFFIHFRRGDYENNSNYTDLSITSYYNDAIQEFQRLGHKNVMVFSNDIEWCKTNTLKLLHDFHVEYDTSEDEIISLARMAACELGGISANSTFGFWALQLNKGPIKILPSPFPMKNIWPLSNEIPQMKDWTIIRLRGQNNYTLIIALVLFIIMSITSISYLNNLKLLR